MISAVQCRAICWRQASEKVLGGSQTQQHRSSSSLVERMFVGNAASRKVRRWSQTQHRYSSSLVERMTGFFTQIFRRDDRIDPKKILERRYLYFGLMALKLRELRADPENKHLSLSEVRLKTVEVLDGLGIDKVTNNGLRVAYLETITPQVEHILSVFRDVDRKLFGSSVEGDEPTTPASPLHSVDESFLNDILQEEQAYTLDELANVRLKEQQQQQQQDESSPDTAITISSRKDFLTTKHEAIVSLLQFHGINSSEATQKQASGDSHERKNRTTSALDSFGMDMSTVSDENFDHIRRYQTINICRSALIRRQLGYSILCLRSTLGDDVGRGAFVDGKAHLGDLVSFTPGEVWAKEHLLMAAPDVVAHFDDDEEDDCQTSLRFDGYLIDSRRSPVTVLTQEGSFNPWGLGHMVNHPNKGRWPNCQSLMLDYTQSLPRELSVYIPNSYARPTTWRSDIFSARGVSIMMRGLSLLARRDLEFEELCYDYRLQSEETPPWYHPILYDDELLDNHRVVFFGNDKKQPDEEGAD